MMFQCYQFYFQCYLDSVGYNCPPSSWNALQWRHNGRDGVPNHQPYDYLLNHLFRGRSKKTSKLRVTGLCEGNSPVTREFPAQRASNAENISIWWRHHAVEIRARRSDCILYGSNSHSALSPVWLQAITWTNAELLSIRPLGTNLSEMCFNLFQHFSFKKIYLKLSSPWWRTFCQGGEEWISNSKRDPWCEAMSQQSDVTSSQPIRWWD